jgi:hypothetical protein
VEALIEPATAVFSAPGARWTLVTDLVTALGRRRG